MSNYTPPSDYRDLDGNHKTFTYIDHDIKTSISTSTSSKKEVEKIKEDRERMMNECIEEILALPAVAAAGVADNIYEQFIIRDLEKGIIWNETVVRNALVLNDTLRYQLHTVLWKRTVKESNWFHPMREDHEAIVRGDWRQLI